MVELAALVFKRCSAFFQGQPASESSIVEGIGVLGTGAHLSILYTFRDGRDHLSLRPEAVHGLCHLLKVGFPHNGRKGQAEHFLMDLFGNGKASGVH